MSRRVESTLVIPEMHSIGRNRIAYNANFGPYCISEATKTTYERHRTQIFSDYNPNGLYGEGETVFTPNMVFPMKLEDTRADYSLAIGVWAVNAGSLAQMTFTVNGTYDVAIDIDTTATKKYCYASTAWVPAYGEDSNNFWTLSATVPSNTTIYGIDLWQFGAREYLPSGSFDCGLGSNLVFPETDQMTDHKPLSIQRYYEACSVLNYIRNTSDKQALVSFNVTQHDTKDNIVFLRRPRVPTWKTNTSRDLIVGLTSVDGSSTGYFTGTFGNETQTAEYNVGTFLTYSVDTITELEHEIFTGSFKCKSAALNIFAYWALESVL